MKLKWTDECKKQNGETLQLHKPLYLKVNLWHNSVPVKLKEHHRGGAPLCIPTLIAHLFGGGHLFRCDQQLSLLKHFRTLQLLGSPQSPVQSSTWWSTPLRPLSIQTIHTLAMKNTRRAHTQLVCKRVGKTNYFHSWCQYLLRLKHPWRKILFYPESLQKCQ